MKREGRILDLDLVNEKPQQIKLFGRQVDMKNVTIKEHLKNEHLVKEIDGMPFETEEDIENAADKIKDYLLRVLDITPEEAGLVSMEQYKKLRQFISRLELYEQGFNDREIATLEKKLVKENLEKVSI